MTLDQTIAAGLVPAARRLARTAAGGAARAESDRRLSREVVEETIAAGFARHFVPAAHGGAESTFADLLQAVAVVGEGCASAAWYASLTAGISRMAAYLPAEGRQELWERGPDTLVVGALMPLGKAREADGGWRLAGTWPFVSAVDFAEWALVLGTAATAGGRQEQRFFALPRADFTVVDSWFTAGMRGTGSNTLVAEDVFVPASRTFTRGDVLEGNAPPGSAPCHRVPLRAVNGLTFAAPVLGAARGALASWREVVAEKACAPGAASLAEPLARSSGEIDAAALLLERAAVVADRGRVTELEQARGTRDAALAADLLVDAVGRLVRSAGTRGQSASHPLQRFWRDVNAAATHAMLQFGPAADGYAGQVLRG
ncbi:hydrolase [Allostreptomyces psammosilenae]|uniref:Alkylation response protein AidB-like acyl-CoA dehydrogenase n=1 Tax=Allostreptomyces psammosilenae TaxID=1892865 RepID=A0A852ZR13_9ACTN|nr:hydrolase [Allostreptomyces psammosilenae]NYI04195.1 alkylation response protein AidB-like acyl-CoA dehydrogenase [Allostreptomyces psammosilenae]